MTFNGQTASGASKLGCPLFLTKRRYFFMLNKIKHAMIFVLFIFLICYGFLKVSSELPQLIKDKSPLKVSFQTKPLDITMETKNYTVYVNKQAADSIKIAAKETFEDISTNNPITRFIHKFRAE